MMHPQGQWYGPPPAAPPPRKSTPAVALIFAVVAFGVIAWVCRGGAYRGILTTLFASSLVAVVVVGKLVPAAPAPFGAIARALTARVGAFVLAILAIGGGGLAGRSWHLSRTRVCTTETARLASAKADAAFGYANAVQQVEQIGKDLASARDACLAVGMMAEVETLNIARSRLDAAAPDIRHKADLEAAQNREASAVARFPTQEADIKAALAGAAKHAAAKDWTEAHDGLVAVQGSLDTFKSTSVEKDPQWVALQKKLDAQRAQIQPQLDIIERRGPPPEFVGGCCLRCLSTLEQAANDPGSIECVRSTVPVVEGPSWKTTTTFRGKNAFGAKVLGTKTFYLQGGRVVDVK